MDLKEVIKAAPPRNPLTPEERAEIAAITSELVANLNRNVLKDAKRHEPATDESARD